MREKLLDLMKNEGLKPSQLAELLEINPAGVSHILAGRNKPGFDLLQKMLRRFPRINPDWLLLDSPQMYRPDAETQLTSNANTGTASSSRLAPLTDGLFSQEAFVDGAVADTETQYTATRKSDGTLPAASGAVLPGQVPIASPATKTGVGVRRVVICYDDNTFESYTPAR